MGLFSSIKDNYKKSEAAVVIQNLLEEQKECGLFQQDPATTANEIITKAWDYKPDILSGKFGKRPHKLSTASFSLAFQISHIEISDERFPPFHLSLGNLLSEYERNGGLYPLTNIDHTLFETALKIFIERNNEFEEKNKWLLDEIDELTSSSSRTDNLDEGIKYMPHQKYHSFEDWLQDYKEAAAEVNDGLKPTNGLYLIDLLEDDPLKRAYTDLVDPIILGKHFGKVFNPLELGFK